MSICFNTPESNNETISKTLENLTTQWGSDSAILIEMFWTRETCKSYRTGLTTIRPIRNGFLSTNIRILEDMEAIQPLVLHRLHRSPDCFESCLQVLLRLVCQLPLDDSPQIFYGVIGQGNLLANQEQEHNRRISTSSPLTSMIMVHLGAVQVVSFSINMLCFSLWAGREHAAAVFNSLLMSAATLGKGPQCCSSGLK